jgi:hypothetical protein
MTSLLSPRRDDPLADARLAAIREHVEVAHREVQAAQRLAYEETGASLRTRLALNKAQDILIRVLIHRLPPR